jgi:uncharacterized LabA/DUF88 family protein
MATWDLVVVDGPNLYNIVSRALGAFDYALRKEYVGRWLDFDRLIVASQPAENPPLGTVFFHSGRHLGSKKTVRLEDREVVEFWARQGSNPYCSTEAVVLPGTQEDLIQSTCEACGALGQSREVREKGVDTAITSFMWETFDRWKSICIVSGDADFVPPARSLKRRGKRVFCLVEPGSNMRDLVQVCTSHVPVDLAFVRADIGALQMLRKNGPLDQNLAALRAQARDPGPGRQALSMAAADFRPALSVKEIEEDKIGPLEQELKASLAKQGWDCWPEKWLVRNEQSIYELRFVLFPKSEGADGVLLNGIRRHRDVVASAEWCKALSP